MCQVTSIASHFSARLETSPDGRYGNGFDFATTGDTRLNAPNITDRNFILRPKRAEMPDVTWQASPYACVSTEVVRNGQPYTESDPRKFLDNGLQDKPMEHPRGPLPRSVTFHAAALGSRLPRATRR